MHSGAHALCESCGKGACMDPACSMGRPSPGRSGHALLPSHRYASDLSLQGLVEARLRANAGCLWRKLSKAPAGHTRVKTHAAPMMCSDIAAMLHAVGMSTALSLAAGRQRGTSTETLLQRVLIRAGERHCPHTWVTSRLVEACTSLLGRPSMPASFPEKALLRSRALRACAALPIL